MPVANVASPTHQRVAGVGELGVAAAPPARALRHLYQQGAARIRLPASRFDACEAVLINTAGGLTGDDRLSWSASADVGASLQVSTAAAEKVYRTHGPPAQVCSKLQVSDAATLEWLPQETILFDAASLTRSVAIDLAPSATLLMLESVILGRRQMGERLRSLQFNDQWRVHRAGKLLHAEALRLDTRLLATASSAGTIGGFTAFATLLYCSPEPEERLRQLADGIQRGWLAAPAGAETCTSGVTVLPSRLVVRLGAIDGRSLRTVLIPVINALSKSPKLPQVWEV